MLVIAPDYVSTSTLYKTLNFSSANKIAEESGQLHFTSLADLFNQIPSQFLLEASSHSLQLMCEMLLVHISTTVYSQVFIYTAELTGAM